MRAKTIDTAICAVMFLSLLSIVCVQLGIRHGRNLEQAEHARTAAWQQEATCR